MAEYGGRRANLSVSSMFHSSLSILKSFKSRILSVVLEVGHLFLERRDLLFRRLGVFLLRREFVLVYRELPFQLIAALRICSLELIDMYP